MENMTTIKLGPQLEVVPNPDALESSYVITGRTITGTPIAVPVIYPSCPENDALMAVDFMVKGHPANSAELGVIWSDLCDSPIEDVEQDNYECIRTGKYRGGIGYLTTDCGSSVGNEKRTLVLQHRGGDLVLGVSGSKVSFFGKEPVKQLKKSEHNNWATMQDVLNGLYELGLIDSP